MTLSSLPVQDTSHQMPYAVNLCAEMFAAKYFWAKTTADGMPGCDVWQHCMAAAEVAKIMLHACRDYQELLPQGVVTLVAVHDVGKISPGFQTKCPMWKGADGQASNNELYKWAQFYEKNHAKSTYDVLRKYYKEYLHCKTGKFWASCAGAHHGIPVDKVISTGETVPEEWWEEGKKLIDAFCDIYGELPTSANRSETLKRLVTGYMIVADWIASNELCFPSSRIIVDYALRAERALQMIGLFSKNNVKACLSWNQLFPHCNNARPLQNYMWSLPAQKGVYVVEDAMGGGKTEAALAFAYHLLEQGKANGIYFALPTQTTSNRIFFRVKKFVENCGGLVNEQSLQLAHGNSWLLRPTLYSADETVDFQSDSSSLELRKWFSSSKRTLLVPYGVGTIDQALMGVVAVKHRDVRAFALAGKVVILDEVHSYDFYTGSLITSLIRQLRESGATVIILSATLTQSRIRELLEMEQSVEIPTEYPLVTSQVNGKIISHSFPASEQKYIQVNVVEQSVASTIGHAYEMACKGCCVLWIRNTVKDAQEAYRVLKSECCEGGPEIGLFHARYPYWRREELENLWIDRLGADNRNRPKGCVLIATQVVEQSVDIDADYLITDLAPSDMLLQRCGRLWRHQRKVRPIDSPCVLINVPCGVKDAVMGDDARLFCQAFGASAQVYAPYILWKTWCLWDNLKRLSIPSDIREIIEKTYDESIGSGTVISRSTLKDLTSKIEVMKSMVLMNQSYSAGVGSDAFTRYGDVETVQLFLLKRKPVAFSDGSCSYEPLNGNKFTAYPLSWNYDVAKCICLNSVRIPKWYLSALSPDSNLQKYGFDGIYPCFVLDNGELMYYNGTTTGLAWNAQIGVYVLPEKKAENEELEFMY